MKQNIANLLLVLGTVLGGIGAANSAKASRWLPLDADAYPGEYVARDVPSAAGDAPPPLVPAGTELTAPVVARLRSAGHTRAEVKDPPVDHELLPGTDEDALLGRILAEDIKLGEEESEVRENLIVTDYLLARCAAAGLATIPIAVQDERRALPTAGAPIPEGARVAETFTMTEDVLAKSGTFLDAPTVAAVVATGKPEIDVRIVKRFRFAGWEQRYLYLGAIVAMLLGVVMKRSGGSAEALASATAGGAKVDVGHALRDLAAKLDALAQRAPSMDAEELHAAVEALLTADVFTIVESRDVVQARHGSAAFVAVFGPFASAERMLNRTWSAAVDGNVEEARAAVASAATGMRVAAEAFPAA